MSRAERKARTRAAILQAARDRFVGVGYEGATIRDVARSAGVAVGTVHAHFPDKPSLLSACFLAQIDDAVALGFESLDPVASLADQLCHLAGVLYAAYARHPALSRVMLQHSLFPATGVPERAQTQAGAFLLDVIGLVGSARSRGAVGEPADGGMAFAQAYFAAYLLTLLGGLSGAFGDPGAPDAHEAWVARLRPLVALQIAGLPAPERSAQAVRGGSNA
jgi:AcrR family transcriptional regulator